MKEIRDLVEKMEENYELYSKARIAIEIQSIDELTDRQLELLLKIGYKIYLNNDYSSLTGIGVIIDDYIQNIGLEDNESSLELYEKIQDFYSLSDWQ